MKSLPAILLCLAVLSPIAAAPRIFGSLSHRLLASNGIVDSVEVTTFVGNEGNSSALSPMLPAPYPIVAIGTDSLSILRNHVITSLDPGFYVSFKDTLRILAVPTALHCWIDPVRAWGDSTPFDNVSSYIIDYHRDQHLDTLFVIVHDTVLIHDTPIQTALSPLHAPGPSGTLHGALYDASGRTIWEGLSEPGVLPSSIHMAAGLHLFVQGTIRKLVQVH